MLLDYSPRWLPEATPPFAVQEVTCLISVSLMDIKHRWVLRRAGAAQSDVGRGVASSPWLLWLDWLVWGQWQGAGVLFMSSGTQGRVLRGLHGEVETIPVPHLRTQGSGPPWKRASNSEEGGGIVVRAGPGQHSQVHSCWVTSGDCLSLSDPCSLFYSVWRG